MLGKLDHLFLNLTKRNTTILLSLVLLGLSGLTLVSCGGGGGGSVPAAPAPPTKVIKVASYGNTTCSIVGGLTDNKGRLSCWGQIPDIAIIDKATGKAKRVFRNQATPQAMSSDATWVDVALGQDHICGIKDIASGSRLFCMGWNYSNQIGENYTISPTLETFIVDNFLESMTQISTINSWVSLSAGSDHTCGIYGTSQLKCWGANRQGVIGQEYDPKNSNKIISPSVDLVSNVLTAKNTPSVDLWLEVSTSDLHTCAIKKIDNSLWCWGFNNVSQLGSANPNQNTNFKSFVTKVTLPQAINPTTDKWITVSTGAIHTCAITATMIGSEIAKQGQLWCWGNNTRRESGKAATANASNAVLILANTSSVDSNTNWTQVEAGQFQTCAINSNGETFCFGYDAPVSFSNNNYPITAVFGQNKGWQNITLGHSHACGIQKLSASSNSNESNLYCWGQQQFLQLGSNFQYNSFIPNLIPAVNNTDPYTWKTLDSGSSHACAIKNDSSMWCWGRNYFGQLGLGSANRLPSSSLQKVKSTKNWLKVQSYSRSSCALTDTNTNEIWCWGQNNRGQLGNGLRIDSAALQQTTGVVVATSQFDTDWDDIIGGDDFTCGLKTDKKLWCWGDNSHGQLGKTASTTPVLNKTVLPRSWQKNKIFSGNSAVCAIEDITDDLYCWGSNDYERIIINSANNTVVSVNKPTKIVLPTIAPNIPAGTNWLDVQIGAGFICAIVGSSPTATEGTLWCWGDNARGTLGNKAHFDKIIFAAQQAPKNRSVNVESSVNVSTPVAIANGIKTQWISLSTHNNSVCAIESNSAGSSTGKLWCWGINTQGQLGINSMVNSIEPVQETTKSPNWVSVKNGLRHTCGLQKQDGKTDYSLWCWGGTSYERQIGDSRLVDLTPKLIQ